jgi:hypothetical protein
MNIPPISTPTFPSIMIGVATAQNTVNTVPAIQLGIKEFQFVQTSGDPQKNWVKNATSALQYKGVNTRKPIFLSNKIDDDLIAITKYIRDRISLDPLIFNIGGGLKVHSLALWELFINRNQPKDLACYSNPQKGVIDFWKWEGNIIKQFTIPLDFDDDLENFLRVFGFSIENPGVKLYENGNVYNEIETFDFFQFTEFREFLSKCFGIIRPKEGSELTFEQARKLVNLKDSETREQLLNEIKLKNVGQIDWSNSLVQMKNNVFRKKVFDQILKFVKEKLLIPNRLQPTDYEFKDPNILKELSNRNLPSNFPLNSTSVRLIVGENSGFYFERILMNEITKILTENDHIIKKAYANVKVKSKDAEAEFDILLLTNQGTFYVLDGKLDEFDKKDENSRKLNVIKSGGVFSSFIPVFSFYPDDLNTDWNTNSIPQKIKDYHLQGIKFMVFNRCDKVSKKISVLNEEVNLPHFSDLLAYLNLKKR